MSIESAELTWETLHPDGGAVYSATGMKGEYCAQERISFVETPLIGPSATARELAEDQKSAEQRRAVETHMLMRTSWRLWILGEESGAGPPRNLSLYDPQATGRPSTLRYSIESRERAMPIARNTE